MRLRTLASVGIAIVWVAACSASGGGDGGSNVNGYGGSSSGTGGAAASGGGGSSNTGGIGAFNAGGSSTGGSGGGLGPDGGCVSTGAVAKTGVLPADIIVAVDTSGSMDLESKWVQQNMGPFSSKLSNSGIDLHVVLISSTDICIPAPLGSGSCPNDSNPAKHYLHVPTSVGSNDALDKFVSEYPKYKSMLRPGSLKYFLVVSDDNATDGPYNSASAFIGWVNSVDPTLFYSGNWKFDGIFSSAPPWQAPCTLISAAAGKVYMDLVQQTGGISGDLCLQQFGPVFDALAQGVTSDAKVPCVYAVPPNPKSGTIDPNKVNVNYLPGGNPPPKEILRVKDKSQCPPAGTTGYYWYFDDNKNPTTILLCGGTCNAVDNDPKAKIDVEFGCESHYKPPS